MTQDSDSGIMGTLVTMGWLLAIFAILGLAFIIIWSIVKTILWIFSPYRSQAAVNISYELVIRSPYFWRIFWSSGVGIFMLLVFYTNLDIADSYIWTDGPTFAVMMGATVVAWLTAIAYMMMELNMIFNFRNWYRENVVEA